MRQPQQVRGICHRALAQFYIFPECMNPLCIELKKKIKKTAQQQVDRNGEQQW